MREAPRLSAGMARVKEEKKKNSVGTRTPDCVEASQSNTTGNVSERYCFSKKEN